MKRTITTEDALRMLKKMGGGGGSNGKDGVSPIVNISKENGVTTITFTDAEGVKVATINDGIDGKDGGVGFFSLEVDDDGNLWANYADEGSAPPFEYDTKTGNLYYEI